MNPFSIKAPLVEKIVGLRSNLFSGTPEEFHNWIFQLRRDLWRRTVPWLMKEVGHRERGIRLLSL